MKIAFTVCSLNRLGQIIVLGNSLLQHNPDYQFIIGLVDEINNRVDITLYPSFIFINLSDLKLKEENTLVNQYDIFELSCALKSYYALYIMSQYQPEIIIYFDTDICVYKSLSVIEEQLNSQPILLSPHYITPIPDDGKFPMERDVLNSGIYNGGFFAIKNHPIALSFLKWWQQRVANQGYNKVSEGMMVDQLWLNLVPLYFPETGLLRHSGCNAAYWNLHERKLEESKDGRIILNNQDLIFFHFSGYNFNHPLKLSAHQNRFLLSNAPILKGLVESYHQQLTYANFLNCLSIPCLYGKKKEAKKHSPMKLWLINFLASFGYKLEPIRKM